MWNKDEVKGKVEQAKGVVKEKVGKATSDPDLQAEGPPPADRGGRGSWQAPKAPPPRAAQARSHAGKP